ncbi:hypothetical protein [Pseudarthrobacter sp. NIBRBAC000502772]|nr:hypothetical protein [Pseudarthrobacter sp. NIBRBAC000502772]
MTDATVKVRPHCLVFAAVVAVSRLLLAIRIAPEMGPHRRPRKVCT